MAIRNLGKRERQGLLIPITVEVVTDKITYEEIQGYKLPAFKEFKFNEEIMTTNDDFDFNVTKTRIDNVDILNNIPDVLNLYIFNGSVFSFWNGRLSTVTENEINKFFIKYFKGLENESWMKKRFSSLLSQVEVLNIRKNLISFNNEEYNDNGDKIENNEDYISKVSFNVDLKSKNDVFNNDLQMSLWIDYINYVYGESHLFDINKTFSTILWTDDFINENMKVLFNITSGGSGRTTIMNKLRDLTLIKQSNALWKNAEKNKFQGNKELQNANQNLIDDPVEKKGQEFIISGDWLKDLTLTEFSFKAIGKDATAIKNTIQNVVFLNKYNFDISKRDYSEIRRIDWIEIADTKDIRTWERYEEFKKSFSYEWLLNYLFYWFVENKENIINSSKEFDVKKINQNKNNTLFVEKVIESEINEIPIKTLKTLINDINYKSKTWNNADYVEFFEGVEDELNEEYDCKFYFSKVNGKYPNFSRSFIKKKNNLPIKKEEIKTETKKEILPKNSSSLKYVSKLKELGLITDYKKDGNYYKYILAPGSCVLDIEPIDKDLAFNEVSKEKLIELIGCEIYSITNGGLHCWFKYDTNKNYVNTKIEELNLMIEFKNKEIFIKDNLTIGNVNQLEEKFSFLDTKKASLESFGTAINGIKFSELPLKDVYDFIKNWNCRNGESFSKVLDNYVDFGIERNNTMFNLHGWLLSIGLTKDQTIQLLTSANNQATNPLSTKELNLIFRRKND